MSARPVLGWDIGGAHVKAALIDDDGALRDAMQWPCPLWRGLEHLHGVLAEAEARWPGTAARGRHAVTMSGEMVDLFEHRQAGVQGIADALAGALHAPRFFAGERWCDAAEAAGLWSDIASANWLAAALHTAVSLPESEGLWIDIGSTTTDLIAFRQGRVLAAGRHDAERLATGELLYHGVSRTPLCALGPRIAWRGRLHHVMNEFFATTADVYRLTGELDPAHDQHPSADNAPKDAPHTRARLARMIGLDARDGSDDEWLAFARAWREAQTALMRGTVRQVAALHGMGTGALAVASGCGAFLVSELVDAGWRCERWGAVVARPAAGSAADLARWAEVCAPAVAVAALGRRGAF